MLKKYNLRQTVKYVGMKFTAEGISPDPRLTEAILKMRELLKVL